MYTHGICISVYARLYIHTYIYLCIHAQYTQVYIYYIPVHMCIHLYKHTHTHAHIYAPCRKSDVLDMEIYTTAHLLTANWKHSPRTILRGPGGFKAEPFANGQPKQL